MSWSLSKCKNISAENNMLFQSNSLDFTLSHIWTLSHVHKALINMVHTKCHQTSIRIPATKCLWIHTVRPNANCANKHNAIAPRPPKPCKSGARPIEQKTVRISLGWIKKDLSWHNDVAAKQWNNAKKWVYSHKQLLSIHPTHSPIQTLYIY